MVTKTDTISGAFTNLGKGPISDIDPTSAEPIVVVAVKKYELLLLNTLQDHPWRFATFTRNLNKLADPPPVETFSAAFKLPADYLNMEKTKPNIPFRVYENNIYANTNEIQIDYRARLDESKFPAYFSLYMEYRLTVDMAMPLTQQIEIKKDWDVSAKQQLILARYQDSQQQTGDVIVNDRILSLHFGSVGGTRSI